MAQTYSKAARSLHWVSFVLIMALWPMGKIMDDDSTGFTGPGLYTMHIWIGLVVCVLTLARVVMHFTATQPPALPMPRWERVLFVANHWGLYLTLALASITGIVMLVSAGMLPLPGETYKPSVFENKAEGPADLHESVTTVFLALAIMHVVGVVYYQWAHGRTLRRMGVPIGEPLEQAS